MPSCCTKFADQKRPVVGVKIPVFIEIASKKYSLEEAHQAERFVSQCVADVPNYTSITYFEIMDISIRSQKVGNRNVTLTSSQNVAFGCIKGEVAIGHITFSYCGSRHRNDFQLVINELFPRSSWQGDRVKVILPPRAPR